MTLGWQKTWGPANPVLFALAARSAPTTSPTATRSSSRQTGCRSARTDSLWAPFVNLKLGVQYTAYTQFNGGSHNFDGAGGNASDNNTLLLFAWLIF